MTDRPSVSRGPLYWIIDLFDRDNQPVNADSLPTILVVKEGVVINGSLDITVTPDATGRYEAEVIGTFEDGDILSITETVSISDIVYTNTWECTILLSQEDEGDGSRPLEVSVQDSDLNFLSGIEITVRDEDGVNIGVKGVTSVNGLITFNLNPGIYNLHVTTANGYLPADPITLNLAETGTVKAAFLLLKDTDVIEGLDLSGVKRVKTKEMEIEAFDPRIVQAARDKENTPLPSFCDVTFCKAVPKCSK